MYLQQRQNQLFEKVTKSPYFVEITWKEGETIEHDASSTLFPVVPISHNGGRVVLSDGKYRGNSSFLTLDDYDRAYDEAKSMLLSRQFPSNSFWENTPRRIVDGDWTPLQNYQETICHMLDLLDPVNEIVQKNHFILRSQEDTITTLYLNSLEDSLLRHEHYSMISAELLHPETKNIRVKNLFSTNPLEMHLKDVQTSLQEWMIAETDSYLPFESGEYPCLMSEQATGVFLHEVVGHLFEADTHVARKLAEKRGTQIAPANLFVGDNPSHVFDDEGTPTQNVWMIYEGKINDLLHSRETARQYNHTPTGHSRSIEGWFDPIPRMHSTVLKSSNASYSDMQTAFKRMIYLENVENAHSYLDRFVLQVGNAYLIENGEFIGNIGSVIVRGSCFKSLTNIVAIGDKPKLHYFTCAKKGQNGLYVSALAPKILLMSVWLGTK